MNSGTERIEISIFGESHAEEIGVEIRGMPEGTTFSLVKIKEFMSRRAPGKVSETAEGISEKTMPAGSDALQTCFTSVFAESLAIEASTKRREPDELVFTKGISVEGDRCTVTAKRVVISIRNTDVRSSDYDKMKNVLRPGHADLGIYRKFGADGLKSGGGAFSGRMTAPLCAAGGIIIQMLEKQGVCISTKIDEIGGFSSHDQILAAVIDARKKKDSLGGIISCRVRGYPAGIGGALFEGLDGKLAKAVFSIPSVRGFELGSGFESSRLTGSQNNDPICLNEGVPVTSKNDQGGIQGGISTGMDIQFRVAFKPVPTIGIPQRTVNVGTMSEVTLEGAGRHDVCIVPRALPIVEAVAAITLYNAIIENVFKGECL